MDGTCATFAEAIAHVSQYVSHFFPASTTLSQGHGRANISSLSLSQVAHERCGNKYFYNGIDITGFTCHYNCDKWMKLKDLWGQIQLEKDKKEKGKGKPKAEMVTTSKCAKALTKRIKSLTKRVAALQEQSDHDPKDPVPVPDTSQVGDDNDEATGPHVVRSRRFDI